jgi:hypothetical protein
MNKHFRVSLNPLVKLFISHLRIINPNLMADDKARFGLARYDEIPQVPVISLDIALSRRETQALFDAVSTG